VITSQQPADWRDLQNEVSRILSECGFEVEIEKSIPIARGSVEIDVYARELVKGRAHTVLVECKHWKGRVPQTVVHAFRTVIADAGANTGYIVSSAGFQAGALAATELTNVKLRSWLEFQDDFELSWFDAHLIPKLTADLDSLMSYTEPLLPNWFDGLSNDAKRKFLGLHQEYADFGALLMTQFSTYVRMDRQGEDTRVPLPLRLRVPPDVADRLPGAVVDSQGYREFMDAALVYGREAIERFDALNPTERRNR
jgi:hypothetical protein